MELFMDNCGSSDVGVLAHRLRGRCDVGAAWVYRMYDVTYL